MRTLVICIAFIGSVAFTSFGQDTKKTVVAPSSKVPESLAVDWTEADRSAGAVRRADEIIAAAAKAYRAAPTVHESIKLIVTLPDTVNETRMDVSYGAKGTLRLAAAASLIVASDGKIYFARDDVKDKYVEAKVEGGLAKAINALLPGFAVPTIALSARESDASIDVTKVAAPFLTDVKILGSRTANGTDQILVEGLKGEGVITFDAATHVQQSLKVRTVDGGVAFLIFVAIETKTAAKLATPIAFEAAGRSAVSSIGDLGEGEPSPLSKVKLGEEAPNAKLATLDGSPFELKSLKGKIVVLDLWATWCLPCKQGLPLLQQFADSVSKDTSIVVYAVDVNETSLAGPARLAAIKDYWTKSKFTMATLVDVNDELTKAFGIDSIPALVIIGVDGKIALIHGGFDKDLKANLTKEVGALPRR